jgi:hypothetical protein
LRGIFIGAAGFLANGKEDKGTVSPSGKAAHFLYGYL